MFDPKIRVRTWADATDAEARTGLIAYLSVTYGALVLDGIALRRTAEGRFALSFPERTDRAGRRHAIVRPADAAARQEIERQILAQLGQRAELGVRGEVDDA